MKLDAAIASPGLARLTLASAVLINHLSTYQSGRGAVMLFFVLSGYWVYDLYLKADVSATWRIPAFYINRILRIYPLYLTVVFIVATVRHHVPSVPEVALFGVASTPFPRLIGTEWSLDVEVQFYACLPLLAAAFERSPRQVWIALMALAVVLGWWLETFGIVTLVKFLPLFGVGMAIRWHRWVPSVPVAMISLAAFSAIAAVLTWFWFFHGSSLHDLMADFDGDAVAAMCIATLMPYLAASIGRPSSKFDRALGDLSYPLYLVHYPVFLVGQYLFNWRSVAGVAAMILAVVIVSLALWVAIDRPAERLRKRILSRRSVRTVLPASGPIVVTQ